MNLTVNFGGPAAEKLKALAKAAVAKATLRVALAVRDRILVNLSGRILRVRTGSLRRTWSRMPTVVDTPAGPAAELSSNLEYAAIHEFGGEIKPVKAKALVFKLDDGTWVRTQLVTMPARRYVSISVEQVAPIADRIVEQVVAAEAQAEGLA